MVGTLSHWWRNRACGRSGRARWLNVPMFGRYGNVVYLLVPLFGLDQWWIPIIGRVRDAGRSVAGAGRAAAG
jgi:hypothetical protein